MFHCPEAIVSSLLSTARSCLRQRTIIRDVRRQLDYRAPWRRFYGDRELRRLFLTKGVGKGTFPSLGLNSVVYVTVIFWRGGSESNLVASCKRKKLLIVRLSGLVMTAVKIA